MFAETYMKVYCRENCYFSIILRVTKIHLNLRGIAAESSTRKAYKILEDITTQEYTKARSTTCMIMNLSAQEKSEFNTKKLFQFIDLKYSSYKKGKKFCLI